MAPKPDTDAETEAVQKRQVGISVSEKNHQPKDHHHPPANDQPDLSRMERISLESVARPSCRGEVVQEIPQTLCQCCE